MATKPTPDSQPTEKDRQRNAVRVELCSPTDTPDDACARTLTRPEVQAAATMQEWEGDSHEVNALTRELTAQVAAVNSGDLKRVEGMLISQAHTLDALFNNLVRRAHGQQYLNQYETYLRLALKAQSQSRATLETLALIKNPSPVAFVRQQNIGVNQQVNNDHVLTSASSRARKTEIEQTKVSGGRHELLSDTQAPALASGADPQMEAMEEIDWSEVARG